MYLFSSPFVNTYVFFGISSVMSLLAYLLGTALHPGFSLRFLSPLWLILDFLASGLTLKTVMLCALASAQRQQTLSALDLNFRKESRDSISFVVTDRLNTSRPGKSTEITFSSSGCASICPFAALKEYISRSETLRFRSGHFVSKLFLSFIRPYNPSVP